MKLNPEELEIETFDTEAGSLIGISPIDTDPNNPTPNTYCFVCD